jgi:uncharacterized protein with ATP-grasp and redox domains
LKLYPNCYQCLRKLASHAVLMATDDKLVREKAQEGSLKVLEDEFSYDKVSIVVATKIHNTIKEITKNPDPYRKMKDVELTTARELYSELREQFADNFKDLLKLSALGNTLDFFRSPEEVRKDMNSHTHIEFTIDDSDRFETLFHNAQKVLYLADNTGEVFFDLPLLTWMRRYTNVLYVVKESPVQNDITIEEIKRAGLEDEIGSMITTGTATPGIDFAQASDRFIYEFYTANLIFAKGMGYWESLSELPAEGRVFHCLMAKCHPVADSLRVPLNSFVAMLR